MAKTSSFATIVVALIGGLAATSSTLASAIDNQDLFQDSSVHQVPLPEQDRQKLGIPDVNGWLEGVWRQEQQPLPDGSTRVSLELFYKHLHAFVRDSLKALDNGPDLKRFGSVPVSLLGDGIGRDFSALQDKVSPFPSSRGSSANEDTIQKLEPLDLADDLLKKLGFQPMSPETRTALAELKQGNSCKPSQQSSCQGFSRKALTEIITLATEAEYMRQFSNLSSQSVKNEAGPGFFAGVGRAVSMVLDSPGYLEKNGISKPQSDSVVTGGQSFSRFEINRLMAQALEEVASLPFNLILEKLRVEKFDSINEANKFWEHLRNTFQGVKTCSGSGKDCSDPAIVEEAFQQYHPIRDFVATILKHQVFEELCQRSGQVAPGTSDLSKCDFTQGGPATGNTLRAMMSLGSSKAWPEAVATLTGDRQQGLDTGSLLRYYAPLYLYLRARNEESRACIGWGNDCENEAKQWIDSIYDPELKGLKYEGNLASWAYQTNINDENAAAQDLVKEKTARYKKKAWQDHISQYEYEAFVDEKLKRRFQFEGILGTDALPEDKFKNYTSIMSKMTGVYGAGKICPYEKQECDLSTEGLTLEPGIQEIIENPLKHSFDKLLYAWKAWRDATGKVIRDQFLQYVELSNEAAVANGFKHNTDMWLSNFVMDDPNFKEDMEGIWEQLSPLYKKVHAYTRHMLRERFGHHLVGKSDPIPAHILGNMWAQDWTNLLALVQPFNSTSSQVDDVNEALKEKTIVDMFELSDSFYVSLGLANTSVCYQTQCGLKDTPENKECTRLHPMIEKPQWDVICHASAWDMMDPKDQDFRIKMCTDKVYHYLITIHHEMGHIQYYSQYKDQPLSFKQGANQAFHEAIGDTMALAVQTPRHLVSIGLLSHQDNSMEEDINFLLKAALEKIVFLPYGYLLDKFRWELFEGKSDPKEMNYNYWKLREEIQGVVPSVNRSEEDFDAGAKYHVTKGDSYIRYFGARLLQFQFYLQMCLDSDQYSPDPSANKPLHLCDFSEGNLSFLAGQKMKRMLMRGSSMPWPDILEEMTGSRKMDASALVEYFAPLEKWLTDYIEAHKVTVGWNSVVDKYFPDRQKN